MREEGRKVVKRKDGKGSSWKGDEVKIVTNATTERKKTLFQINKQTKK